jgi:hypothetical protein
MPLTNNCNFLLNNPKPINGKRYLADLNPQLFTVYRSLFTVKIAANHRLIFHDDRAQVPIVHDGSIV